MFRDVKDEHRGSFEHWEVFQSQARNPWHSTTLIFDHYVFHGYYLTCAVVVKISCLVIPYVPQRFIHLSQGFRLAHNCLKNSNLRWKNIILLSWWVVDMDLTVDLSIKTLESHCFKLYLKLGQSNTTHQLSNITEMVSCIWPTCSRLTRITWLCAFSVKCYVLHGGDTIKNPAFQVAHIV